MDDVGNESQDACKCARLNLLELLAFELELLEALIVVLGVELTPAEDLLAKTRKWEPFFKRERKKWVTDALPTGGHGG